MEGGTLLVGLMMLHLRHVLLLVYMIITTTVSRLYISRESPDEPLFAAFFFNAASFSSRRSSKHAYI